MKNNYVKRIIWGIAWSGACLADSYAQGLSNEEKVKYVVVARIFVRHIDRADDNVIGDDDDYDVEYDEVSRDIGDELGAEKLDQQDDDDARTLLALLIEAEDRCYRGHKVAVVDWKEQNVLVERTHPLCRALRDMRCRFSEQYAQLTGKTSAHVMDGLGRSGTR